MKLIENGFGFEVLTGSYNKLRNLANGTQKTGSPGLEWCSESMYMELKRKQRDPGELTNGTFFIKGWGGTPSWIALSLAPALRMRLRHQGTRF